MSSTSGKPVNRGRIRTATVLGALGLVTILVASCAPASGLPDARQFDVPGCTFEVRIGQSGGVAGVDVRRDGLEPPFVADPTRDCGTHPGVELELDGTNTWFCDSYDQSGGTQGIGGQCYSYSAGIVGGTWYGASAQGTLQRAYVMWTDEYDATHRVQVYP